MVRERHFKPFKCFNCRELTERTAPNQKYCFKCAAEIKNPEKKKALTQEERQWILDRTYIELTSHKNIRGHIVLLATLHTINHVMELSRVETNRRDLPQDRKNLEREMSFWARLFGITVDISL